MSDDVASAGLPMTTALELPGMTIGETLGVVYGLVVRSMGFTGGVAASFKARLMGADAIIAVRFDSSEIGQQFTEIVAYGTAVKAHSSA